MLTLTKIIFLPMSGNAVQNYMAIQPVEPMARRWPVGFCVVEGCCLSDCVPQSSLFAPSSWGCERDVKKPTPASF